MNTIMNFSNLKCEHYEDALAKEQGLVFVYTFLRERRNR